MAGACSGCHSSPPLWETRCSQAFHMDIETPNWKGEEQRHILTCIQRKSRRLFKGSKQLHLSVRRSHAADLRASVVHTWPNVRSIIAKHMGTHILIVFRERKIPWSSSFHLLWPYRGCQGWAPRSLSWALRSFWHFYWGSSWDTWETLGGGTDWARLLIGYRVWHMFLSLKYRGFKYTLIIFIKFWELLVHWQLEQWLQIPVKPCGEMRCLQGWTGFRKRIALPYTLRHGSFDGYWEQLKTLDEIRGLFEERTLFFLRRHPQLSKDRLGGPSPVSRFPRLGAAFLLLHFGFTTWLGRVQGKQFSVRLPAPFEAWHEASICVWGGGVDAFFHSICLAFPRTLEAQTHSHICLYHGIINKYNTHTHTLSLFLHTYTHMCVCIYIYTWVWLKNQDSGAHRFF